MIPVKLTFKLSVLKFARRQHKIVTCITVSLVVEKMNVCLKILKGHKETIHMKNSKSNLSQLSPKKNLHNLNLFISLQS